MVYSEHALKIWKRGLDLRLARAENRYEIAHDPQRKAQEELERVRINSRAIMHASFAKCEEALKLLEDSPGVVTDSSELIDAARTWMIADETKSFRTLCIPEFVNHVTDKDGVTGPADGFVAVTTKFYNNPARNRLAGALRSNEHTYNSAVRRVKAAEEKLDATFRGARRTEIEIAQLRSENALSEGRKASLYERMVLEAECLVVMADGRTSPMLDRYFSFPLAWRAPLPYGPDAFDWHWPRSWEQIDGKWQWVEFGTAEERLADARVLLDEFRATLGDQDWAGDELAAVCRNLRALGDAVTDPHEAHLVGCFWSIQEYSDPCKLEAARTYHRSYKDTTGSEAWCRFVPAAIELMSITEPNPKR